MARARRRASGGAAAKVGAAAVALALAAGGAAGFSFPVEPGVEECVYEELGRDHLLSGENAETMRTEVHLAFVVNKFSMTGDIMGGNWRLKPNVTARVTEPDGKVLWEKTDCSDEKADFAAHGVGLYSICFYNNGPSGEFADVVPFSKKVANIDIDIFMPVHLIDDPEDIRQPHGHEEHRNTKLASQQHVYDALTLIVNMEDDVKLIKREQKHMERRQMRHKQTVDSNAFRNTTFAFLEMLLFVGLAVLQIVLMRYMFAQSAK